MATDHVASDGGLGRGNTETLAEYAHPVGETRTMPQQHPGGGGGQYLAQ